MQHIRYPDLHLYVPLRTGTYFATTFSDRFIRRLFVPADE
jgi:hypothetical protein